MCLLHFSKKEVGRLTISEFLKMYQHYKNYYDFTLTKKMYSEIEEEEATRGMLTPM